jgi:hypothetical protein
MFDGADHDVAKSGKALAEQAQRYAFARAGIPARCVCIREIRRQSLDEVYA